MWKANQFMTNNPLLNIKEHYVAKQQQLNNNYFMDSNSYSCCFLNNNELTFYNNYVQVTKEKIKFIFNKSLDQSVKFWLHCIEFQLVPKPTEFKL